MKAVGLIGGMSWESSALYYRIINEETRLRLGGNHSAQVLLHSLNFHEIEAAQHEGAWERLSEILVDSARRLERAGAQAIVLCTNTMHKLAEPIERAVRVPLLHIADALAKEIRRQEVLSVGLLGTRFTMEEPFYRERVERTSQAKVVIPDTEDRAVVHDIIYKELCRGLVRAESRERYRKVIQSLVSQGARAIVLGCTEIGMLIGESDSPVPVLDTTRIHALAAVDFALGDS